MIVKLLHLKKTLLSISLIILLMQYSNTNAATIRGPDGRWLGNICLTQAGAVVVPWQPVGSICHWPARGLYGFILNE